jgi:hypothetical protein
MDDASQTPPASASALSQAELDALTDKLIEKLKTVFDPEIPVDIYELGLIYKVDRHDPHRPGMPCGRRHARLGAGRRSGDPGGHRL